MTEGEAKSLGVADGMIEQIADNGSGLHDRLLEPSPYLSDAGEKVGRLPRNIPVEILRELGHPESPIKAIRANCVVENSVSSTSNRIASSAAIREL